MEVGRHLFLLSSIFLLILPCFIEAGICDAAGACTPVSKFDFEKVDLEPKTTKECADGTDACAIFWCLIDHKKVMAGLGCYSDYVSICGSVSNNAVVDIKNLTLINDAEGYNAKVYACEPKEDDDCAVRWWDTKRAFGGDYFGERFIVDADKSYDKECSYPPEALTNPVLTSLAPILTTPSSSAMKQMNDFQLFGIMILLGFFLAQIW